MERFELVVPAYNEAKNLDSVIRRAVNAAKSSGLSPERFTLVVVQNGSLDDSDKVLQDLSRTSDLGPWFKVVKVPQNRGYGYGLWQGLKATTAEFVGWTHADQQCDPKHGIDAFLTLSKGQENALIKGVRIDRNRKDRFVSRVFEFMARLILGVSVYEMNAQPKVFKRALLKNLKNPPQTFAFDLYVLYNAIKANYTIKTIPVSFPPRIHGMSKWASTFFSRYKTILGMIRYMVELRKQEGRV